VRKALKEVLAANAPLVAALPANRWFAAGAVTDTPTRPFIVLRWLSPVSLDGGRYGEQLQVQVHDERGSYVRIEAVLKLVDPVLRGVAQYVGSDGRITQCDYTGHSGDQEDLDLGTNMKFSSWQVIGVSS
jgi:hypothetical protein